MLGGKIPVQGGACEESAGVSMCYVYCSLLLEGYHGNSGGDLPPILHQHQ